MVRYKNGGHTVFHLWMFTGKVEVGNSSVLWAVWLHDKSSSPLQQWDLSSGLRCALSNFRRRWEVWERNANCDLFFHFFFFGLIPLVYILVGFLSIYSLCRFNGPCYVISNLCIPHIFSQPLSLPFLDFWEKLLEPHLCSLGWSRTHCVAWTAPNSQKSSRFSFPSAGM